MKAASRRSCRLVVLDDARRVAIYVAGRVMAFAARHPASAIGLAAGTTMTPIYREIVARHRRDRTSFARHAFFGLDEFAGLAPDHPAGFAHFLHDRLLDHIDADPRRIRLPRAGSSDREAEAEAEAYEDAIAVAGGIGLQLLGIGANGHIGFNEPGSRRSSRTLMVALSAATRRANASSFPPGEAVPGFGLTMGIGTIMEARTILLAAVGATKAGALARALDGPLDTQCPASVLRLHPSATIVCDRDAARELAAWPPDAPD